MRISNLKWREAMAEVRVITGANTFFSPDECLAGWPETLKPDQLAVLQRPYIKGDTLQAGKTTAFREWIESACLAGLLPHIRGKEIKHRERRIPAGAHLYEKARLLTEDTSYEVDVHHIKACDFATLLASEGEEPSVHLAAWIKATASESPVLPAEAADASGNLEADKAGPAPLKAETVPDCNAPAAVAVSASGAVDQSTNNAPKNKYRDLMTPVIEAAQRECIDHLDTPAVWAVLARMANSDYPPLPLLGLSDEGIKWLNANDEPNFFKLKNLRDRLSRKKKAH